MPFSARDFAKNFTLLIILCAGLSSAAIAGGTQTGQVSLITVRASDGLVLIELTGSASNKPACAPFTYWIIKDEASLAGKQHLALLMEAKATGRTVAISGSGYCTRWHDGEDIDTVQLQ